LKMEEGEASFNYYSKPLYVVYSKDLMLIICGMVDVLNINEDKEKKRKSQCIR